MAEYIKREYAVDAVLDVYCDTPDINLSCEKFEASILKIPAADVEPVVRCRECKYWGDEDGKLQRSDGVLFARCKIHNYLLDGRHTGWCPTENDFCSYGERKEGADNG